MGALQMIMVFDSFWRIKVINDAEDLNTVTTSNGAIEYDVVGDGKANATNYNNNINSIEHAVLLQPNDIIYKDQNRNTVPIVIEEYNLVFFPIAKAASTEWKRFFLRLEGNDNWCGKKGIHNRDTNGQKYLSDYSIEQAQNMMTSPDWTRAVFVRNPKPRLLSSFLDKCIQNSKVFARNSCPIYARNGSPHNEINNASLVQCQDLHENFDFFLHNITRRMHNDVHFMPILSFVDRKWWPHINYIRNMEDLRDDAEDFLKTIRSNIDNISAWDRIGKTEWSNHKFSSCVKGGGSSFLATRDDRHRTDAITKMHTYYTPELEKFVEEAYKDDYNNPYYQFKELQLFPKT